MRHLFSIVSTVVFLSISLYCAAQEEMESAPNTFHIKKKIFATPEEVGARFFKLYCREAIDTLVMEFFPTQEIALEFCRQGNTDSTGELYRYVKDDFYGMMEHFRWDLSRNIESDKDHNIPLHTLRIDSVTFSYPDSDAWKGGTAWKLLNVAVHATDGKDRHHFYVVPLFGYKDRWYVFSTELGFGAEP